MTEEYFTNIANEQFVNLSNDPVKNDISKTIAINCKAYPTIKKKIMVYKAEPNESLDTPYYAQYKPLEYSSDRKYYWRAGKLVEEGIRRSGDDDIEIAKIKALYDKETDPDKLKILEDKLSLFKWRSNILSTVEIDPVTKKQLDREQRDIMTDYLPEIIGMNRPWIERHSHISDYSY